MPEHSSRPVGAPDRDSVFAQAPDLATDITRIADSDAGNLEHEGAAAKKRLGWAFWIAVGVFGVIAVAALLAPWLPLKSYTATLGKPKTAPNGEFWMGTDALGRDIFSRVVWGGRVSLLVGFVSIFLGLVIGGTVGVIAGFRRGRIETLLMGAMDVLLSFPSLLRSK